MADYKEKKKRKINWSEYNESLVRRGEIMFDTDFLGNWRAELKKMNEGKEGATKYRYPNSLIFLLLATIHVYLLPYRQLEGFLRIMAEHIEKLKEVPDYTTMWWRVMRVKVELKPEIDPDRTITIAVDSTGIKVSNRGEWIHDDDDDKWKKRRGFIKIHVAVDVVRTKKILSMMVTKEDVYDGSRMLKPLVKEMQATITIQKVIADGAYDSRKKISHFLAMQGESL